MLEEAECDVLILLDCCAAASSGGSHGKGVTELIAACGFEAFAPGVGEHSFTRSLIEELKYLSQRCDSVTTALLHNKVLARIKKSWNPRYSSNGSQERRRTPIHIHLSDDTKQRCIKLAPLQPLTACTPSSNSLHASSSGSSDPSTSASEDVDMIGSDETSPSSLSEVWPDKKFESPKVLISVALQEDQRLNAEDWLEWLKSVPALANLVQVEGVFKSDSTLLILTLPVALWDSIPRDPAVTFLAFVRSHNLSNPSHQHSQGISTAVFHSTLRTESQDLSDNPYPFSLPPKAGYSEDNSPNYAHGNIPALDPFSFKRMRPSPSQGSDDSGYASGLYPYQFTEHNPPGLLGTYGPNYYTQRPDSWYNQSQFPTIPAQAGAAVGKSTHRPQ